MTVAFYWCHTPLCQNYGRARRLDTANHDCPYCGVTMKIGEPDEEGAVDMETKQEHTVSDEQGRMEL